MSDVFQEVDQSLREESLAKFWKRWSPFIYGAIVAVVIGVGVWEVVRWQRSEAVNRAAKTYDAGFMAMQAGDLATARARFAELAKSDTGFAVLSGHMLAGVERDLTNDPAAVEADLKAAAAADKNGVMGDLAVLKLGYLKADTTTLPELEATLKPLTDKTTGQAPLLAKELIAAKALATGDVERARDLFEALNVDIGAPNSMRQRVAQALATLPARKVDLDAPVPPVPAGAAPPVVVPAPAAPTGQPQQ